MTTEHDTSQIAIIGMAGRFPGARNVDEFWHNISRGIESISFLSESDLRTRGINESIVHHPRFVPAVSSLDEIDRFAASFFGYQPRDVELMDPQQRILLECSWEALENAAYNPRSCKATIGAFMGAGPNTYLLYNIASNPELLRSLDPMRLNINNSNDFLATRIAYKLGLQGPCLTVQTACSTSLVAVHLACQSLADGESDMALAGGVCINVHNQHGYFYIEDGIVSPDGHCRTFDAQAAGTIFGSGVGVVVLKRLADAITDGDTIYALIKGSAINNDGSHKVGYTAPSVDGQMKVIVEALSVADIPASSINYVEAHGTATALGDPIEIQALTAAYRVTTEQQGFCAIGSVKTNVGHLDAAAGMAGLLKTVLALHHKQIPPTINFRQLSPQIDLTHSPFYVNTELKDWPRPERQWRRAGVSAFGVGGTNAHVVLEEAPEPAPSGPSRSEHVLCLSAKSARALEEVTDRVVAYLTAQPEVALADVAYTLTVGRVALDFRRTVVCTARADAIALLQRRASGRVLTSPLAAQDRPVVFMFPGQGPQYVRMAQGVYGAEPVFRQEVDRCAALLEPHVGCDIRTLLFPAVDREASAAEQMTQTRFVQPLLFVIEYALARLLISWGIHPHAMIGHSVGEYVAACLAEVFSLEDGLVLIAERGRLMESLRPGAMLTVSLREDQLQAYLSEQISLAAVNGPSTCVVAGESEAIATLERDLSAQDIRCRQLRATRAFHSHMMDAILDRFAQFCSRIRFVPPRIPFISNVTGQWITGDEAASPAYWVAHVRHEVRFGDGLQLLVREPRWLLLEVGPGHTLSNLAREVCDQHQHVYTTVRHARGDELDSVFLLETLARLWLAGVVPDWSLYYADERRRHIPLPTYPFERESYWIAPITPQGIKTNDTSHIADHVDDQTATIDRSQSYPEKEASLIPDSFANHRLSNNSTVVMSALTEIVCRVTGIAADQISTNANILQLGVDSLLLLEVNQAIKDTFDVSISLRQFFEELNTLDALTTHLVSHLPLDSRFATATSTSEMESPPAPTTTIEIQAIETATPLKPTGVFSVIDADNKLGAVHLEAEDAMRMSPSAYRLMEQQLSVISEQLSLLQQISAASVRAEQATIPQMTGVGRSDRLVSTTSQSSSSTATAREAANKATHNAVNGATHDAATSVQQGQPTPYVPFQPLHLQSNVETEERQRRYLETFIEQYERRTAQSKQLAQVYRHRLANNRSVAGFRLYIKEIVYQILVERAKGSRLWDVDGNEYIDLTMGFGVYLFGHDAVFIKEAVEAELQRGISIGPMNRKAGEVATLISQLTGVERVAFYNSGTEAVMVALRLARSVSRRSKIVIFAGSYHGTFDGVLARAKQGQIQAAAVPIAPGILPAMVEDVIVLPYDEPASLDMIRDRGHELAAVLVEPVQSRRPDVQPKHFLRELRTLTKQCGAALIFDEIITGFRTHPGGAQAWFDVQADLVIYGKVLGGGLPIGVVAGCAEYMDAIDGGQWQYGDESYPPHEEIRTFVSGTFCHHPYAMASTWAILNCLKEAGPGLQHVLTDRTARLVQTLNTYFADENVPIRVVHFGSLFRFVLQGDLELFYYHLIHRGIYVWEGRTCFLSTAHSDEDVERIVQAVKHSVEDLRTGGFLPASVSRSTNGHKEASAADSLVLATSTSAEMTTTRDDAIERAQEPLTVPLTIEQQQLWLLTQMSAEASVVYHELILLDLHGPLNVSALQHAIHALVQRHEALRTTIDRSGEVQYVTPALTIEVPYIELDDTDDHNTRVQEILVALRQEDFDLSKGPLLHVRVVKMPDQHHLLMFVLHHIIVDAWSLGILLREVATLYEGAFQQKPSQLPPPVPFRDYVAWKQLQTHTEDYTCAYDYWREQCQQVTTVLQLPTDYPRTQITTYNGHRYRMMIEPTLWEGLKRVGSNHRVTVFAVFLAAFNVLLHRLTTERTIVIEIPSAGQPLMGAPDLVGQCITMLPIISAIEADLSFADYVARLQSTIFTAMEYQRISFNGGATAAASNFDVVTSPETPVMFNMDHALAVPAFWQLTTTLVPPPIEYVNADLSLNVFEIDHHVSLDFDYRAQLFREDTIRNWARHFELILRVVATDFSHPISLLPLPDDDLRQTRVQGKPTDPPARLHELIQMQAQRIPQAPALIGADDRLSYQQLNEQANRVARYLQSLGIDQPTRVAVVMPRSSELIVAVLAILKSGNSYVVIDPLAASERIQTALKKIAAKIVVTTTAIAARLSLESHQHCVPIDVEAKSIARKGKTNLGQHIPDGAEACIVYNRNSESYGLVMDHNSMAQHVSAVQEYLQLSVEDTVLIGNTPLGAWVLERALPALANGAALLLLLEQPSDDTVELQREATVVDVTIDEIHTVETWTRLRTLVINGSDLYYVDLHKNLFALEQARRILAMYSPTGMALTVSAHVIDLLHLDSEPRRRVGVGRPLNDVVVQVRNDQGYPTPIGTTGRICVGGRYCDWTFLADEPPGIAINGGVNTSDRTLFKTPDLGIYCGQEEFSVIGPAERTTRVRGFLVQHGDVESVLRSQTHVRKALVYRDVAGPESLLTSVVALDEPDTVTGTELRNMLVQRLPSYMIPARIVVVDALPIGMLDSTALEKVAEKSASDTDIYVAPRTPLEQQIVEIWSEVLGCKQISVFDNFFDLGGQSLIATQLHYRLCQDFDVHLPLRCIIEAPTVADLAQAIVQQRSAETDEQLLADVLKELDQLSDEDIQILLADSDQSREM